MGLPLAHLGRTDEARAVLAQSLDRFGPLIADGRLPVLLAGHLLETAVILGDSDAADLLAAPLSTLSSRLFAGSRCALTSIGRLLGGAAALRGDREQVRAYYQQGLEVSQKARFRPEIALIRLELAELLLKESPAEALAHLDLAIAEFQEMKMQPALERALKHKGLLHA